MYCFLNWYKEKKIFYTKHIFYAKNFFDKVNKHFLCYYCNTLVVAFKECCKFTLRPFLIPTMWVILLTNKVICFSERTKFYNII